MSGFQGGWGIFDDEECISGFASAKTAIAKRKRQRIYTLNWNIHFLKGFWGPQWAYVSYDSYDSTLWSASVKKLLLILGIIIQNFRSSVFVFWSDFFVSLEECVFFYTMPTTQKRGRADWPSRAKTPLFSQSTIRARFHADCSRVSGLRLSHISHTFLRW